jgi:outer membrane immunogenic protein
MHHRLFRGLAHMNRCLATASVLAVIAIATQASAADLPARSPAPVYTKAPEYAPVSNWSGWYVGGNIGWTGGSNSFDSSGVATGDPFSPENSAALAQSANQHFGASSGVIGGGQIGFNYRISPSFVAGIEADLQGVGSTHKTSSALGAVAGNSENVGVATSTAASYGPSYLGTFRARLGVTVIPSLLLYATAGLAYGGVNSSTTLNPSLVNAQIDGPIGLVPSSGSSSETRFGYAAGAGAEWMFASNWSAKLEYLHYDLGSATYGTGGLSFNEDNISNIGGSSTASASTSSTVHLRNEIVRVGVNYHFH